MHFYNELDPYAAQWLRNLCDRNLIAPGRVDERSIRDLTPDDVAGHGQRHFFAGIGGWSLALRMAGWPDELDVWTGSCPCQPFSAAGQRKGAADDRHLWPDFFRLIDACRPVVVFGEQVASKDALVWLDTVFADLEGSGYTCRAVDLCAAGVGAPHIRQRLWWAGVRLADAERHGGRPDESQRQSEGRIVDGRRGADVRLAGTELHGDRGEVYAADHRESKTDRPAKWTGGCGGASGGRGHPGVNGARQHARELSGHEGKCEVRAAHGNHASVATGATGRLAHPHRTVIEQSSRERSRPCASHSAGPHDQFNGRGELAQGQPTARPTNGDWRDADWLFCRDGKWRPVEPGTFPLAHGVPGRVGRLRAYGNAIVPQVAAEFIGAVMDMLRLRHNHPGCPLDQRIGVQVKPDPAVEPPSIGTAGKSVKVIFGGEREARWVALEDCEVVRS